MTKRVHQGTAIVGIIFAIMVMAGSMRLQFYTRLGPGPGFFPFILSAMFCLLSFAWLVQCSISRSDTDSRKFLPGKAAMLRVGGIIVALFGVSSLMDLLGFQISMFLFLFCLVRFLGKRKPLETTIVSVAGSVGVYLLFGKLLGLVLPASGIAFLAAIGL